MAKAKAVKADLSTEEKIKEAARQVFTQKGYAATRTRDIAEASGINLALLNYYFRSKEKLFELVMSEKVAQLFGIIAPILNDPQTSLEKKIEVVADTYLDMISKNPDLPLFVLNEIRTRPEHFKNRIPIDVMLKDASLIKQLKERRPDLNPMHFLLNMLGLCVFPFIAAPVFAAAGVMDDKMLASIIKERKQLIPVWLKAMLKAK